MMGKPFFSLLMAVVVSGFVPIATRNRSPHTVILSSPQAIEEVDDAAIQWDLFKKHHAKGSWRGVWTTHDYIGDVVDETIGSVDLKLESDDVIEHTHTIVFGAKKSDCPTCFDSMELKTLPVATYTPENLRKSRFAAVSMVNGPTVLKSGAMATELILKHGDGRIRVIFQHAPVWEQGVEPGSCPPQGLKIFRVMISREALRPMAPTAQTEASDPPREGNPVFFRPVPPFNWHKKWSGTSWTWGPSSGNLGWRIEEMEETDSWHGITPVESWNLRMGPLHVQCPRVITPSNVGICRLAWLPDDENLLRVEAGVQALQPLVLEDDIMVGFESPTLTSLRCDIMKKTGELENAPRPSRDWTKEDDKVEAESSTSNSSNQQDPIAKSAKVNSSAAATKEDPDCDQRSIRDVLSL